MRLTVNTQNGIRRPSIELLSRQVSQSHRCISGGGTSAANKVMTSLSKKSSKRIISALTLSCPPLINLEVTRKGTTQNRSQ